MLDIENPEIKFTLQAVRQAALLVRHIQSTLITPAIEKNDRSPVTVADFASQALIGKLLMQAFPNDPLVAEEDSTALRAPGETKTLEQVTQFVGQFTPSADDQSVCRWIDHGNADGGERFWTLDPIDGTKGFLRGEQYAVALALVVGGAVQVGALGCPNLVDAHKPAPTGVGSLVVAARGQGAWVTELETPGEYRKLQVSAQNDPHGARVLRSVESGHTNVSQIDIFAQQLGIEAEPVRMDSQAKYALLASGHGEYYLRLLSPSRPDYREKIWDQAAGALILEEAGGRITDLHGKPLDFTVGRQLKNNRGILGSNGLLHDHAVGALEAINA
jgi:3'(2'), 5'-bisphosphate nucleotidase